jgi:hypothetical protein
MEVGLHENSLPIKSSSEHFVTFYFLKILLSIGQLVSIPIKWNCGLKGTVSRDSVLSYGLRVVGEA